MSFAVTLLAATALAAGAALAATTAPAERSPTSQPADAGTPAAIIRLHGDIDDASRDAVFRRFRESRELGAEAIILDINTYGGLVTAGLDISRFLKQQDDLHVIAFIDEKAISAGVMIALAADEIVMSPGSMMGDSAPISVGAGGLQTLGEAERAKAESPILADFYESAVKNGYDPLLAQAMVSVGRSVYWIENDAGERRFVDAATYQTLTSAPSAATTPSTTSPAQQQSAWRPVPGAPNPVDGENTLLTVHSDLAVKLGLASGIASSTQALAQERNLQIVATLAPSPGERLIGWLGGAVVRFILLLVFTQSLYAALHAPGHGFPEAIALTSLGVLVGVPMITGYAQWWEVLAIVLGLALLAVEIFVLPGFGIPGITGIVLFLYGLTMTFVGDEPGKFPVFIPSLKGTRDALTQALFIVTAGMGCSLFLWFWLNRYLPKLPYFNRLILTTTAGSADAAVPSAPAVDTGPFVGERGEAITDLRPGGSARLDGDGRVAAVVSDSGFVKAGAKLVVREVAGNRIVVRPVTQSGNV